MDLRPCVLLAAGIDALAVSRLPGLFHAAGYDTTLLGSPGLVAFRSRHVARRIACGRSPEKAAAALLDHLANHRTDYRMIVVADEPTLWEVLKIHRSGGANGLSGWFPVPLDDWSLRRLESKIDFLRDARDAGILTPDFRICATPDEVMQSAESIGYPVFVKATQGLAGSGLRFAGDAESLRSQLSALGGGVSLMVQRQIEGRPGSISVLYREGKPVCWFGYSATRTWPTPFAASCVVEFTDHPDIERLARQVGALTGFSGLAGIDWIHDGKSDRLLLLELNPRPTPVYHLGPKAGVDFSAALRGWPDHCAVQKPRVSGERHRLFPQNLFDAIQNRSPWEFAATFTDAPWDDPGVIAAHLRRVATHYLPERIRRSARAAVGKAESPTTTQQPSAQS